MAKNPQDTSDDSQGSRNGIQKRVTTKHFRLLMELADIPHSKRGANKVASGFESPVGDQFESVL